MVSQMRFFEVTALIMFVLKSVPLNISTSIYTSIMIQCVPSLSIISPLHGGKGKIGRLPSSMRNYFEWYPFSFLQTQCSFREFLEAAILFPVKCHISEEC